LFIRLLGSLKLSDSSETQIRLAGRKDRALLAFLAMHPGSPVSRDRLVDLIWPDAADGAGRASLRQSLSTIRKALPATLASAIHADRDTVTLDTDLVETDVSALEHLRNNETPTLAFEPLIDGVILDGLGDVSASFDTWRAGEVSRLVPLAVDVLTRMADQAEREHRFADAIHHLSQAIVADPMAEAVTRRLMRLHAKSGRPEVALRHYRAFEIFMDTELGTRPDKSTQDLARDIRNARSKTSPPDHQAAAVQDSDFAPPAVLVAAIVEPGDADGVFALSFTECVILALARFRETPVVDLKSVKAVEDLHPGDVCEMARAVGAAYVLSGTIRRSAERLRVNAQLVDAASGRTVWADKFDAPINDILVIEDELSAKVATAIAGHIEDEAQRRARAKQPSDLAVIEWVMRGRYNLNLYTRAGEDEAKRCFTKALDLDPECVSAIAGLAISHLHDFESRSPDFTEEQLREAQAFAGRALALDENDAHARYAMASSLCYLGGHDLALQHCNRALEANPNDYLNICTMGWILTFRGDVEEGLIQNSKAINLNPYAPNICLMVSGFGLIVRGEFDEAVRKLSMIRVENMFKQGGLAACYHSLGRERDAELAASAFSALAEQDFPGDAGGGFEQTRAYWRRMFCFAKKADAHRFYGALNDAGIPV